METETDSPLRSDFTQIDDANATQHPAFAFFVKEMDGRRYGWDTAKSPS